MSGKSISDIVGVSKDVPNQGSDIVPVGTINPDNTSSLGANLINGNQTDLCYNNSSPGSSNKALPAIDL